MALGQEAVVAAGPQVALLVSQHLTSPQGKEAARSASEERTGNLHSQIPKAFVSLCQGKGHPARVHSKGGVTSNKV